MSDRDYLVGRLRYGLRTFSHDVHHAGHETLEEAKRILASTPDLVYSHRDMCDAIDLIRAEQQKRADNMPTTAKVPVLLDDDSLGTATVPVRRATFALLEKARQTEKQDGVNADLQLKVSNPTPPDGLSLGLYLLSVYWPMGRLPVELPPDVEAFAQATRAYAEAVHHFRDVIEGINPPPPRRGPPGPVMATPETSAIGAEIDDALDEDRGRP